MNDSKQATAPPLMIVEFLKARLDETEAAAQVEQIPIPPDRNPDGSWMTVPGQPQPGDARVLADIAAKRRIVERYEQLDRNLRDHRDDLASKGAFLALHGVVELLASGHSDHPDYQEEWRP